MSIQDLKTAAAVKLDERVADGKLVPYWRDFFHLSSIHWSLTGFVIALAGAVALAWGVDEPLRKVFPQIVVNIIMACVFLAVMWERMKPKDPPPP